MGKYSLIINRIYQTGSHHLSTNKRPLDHHWVCCPNAKMTCHEPWIFFPYDTSGVIGSARINYNQLSEFCSHLLWPWTSVIWILIVSLFPHQAFTLVHLFGSLTGTLFVIPLALKPISESVVALRRIQVGLVKQGVYLMMSCVVNRTQALVFWSAGWGSKSWDLGPHSADQGHQSFSHVGPVCLTTRPWHTTDL